MKTDINRLHQVNLGEHKGMCTGQTVADCHKIAGIIELGEDTGVLCVIPQYNWLDHIGPMLRKILFEHELVLIRNPVRRNAFKCGHVHITFISECHTKNNASALEGYDVIVYFT